MRFSTGGHMAGAALVASCLSVSAALADPNMPDAAAGVRLYLSVPFHQSPTAPERTAPRLGMQLFGSISLDEQPMSLHLSDQMPLVDLGFTQQGLGKLDFMGADVLDAYQADTDGLDFVGTMVSSMITTGLILVAIPVGAAIYCDATECTDYFREKAEDEIQAQASAHGVPAN